MCGSSGTNLQRPIGYRTPRQRFGAHLRVGERGGGEASGCQLRGSLAASELYGTGVVQSRKACDQSVNCVSCGVARRATSRGRLIADVEIPARVASSSSDGLSSPGRPLPKRSARLGTRRSSRRMCGRRRAAKAAHKLHDACAWGSSGDARLSGAVIEKCEAVFLGRLTPAQKRNYAGASATLQRQICETKIGSLARRRGGALLRGDRRLLRQERRRCRPPSPRRRLRR